MSIDHNTIFDNAPDPKPRGPWMQQTFQEEQQPTTAPPQHPNHPGTASIAWNPAQQTGDPESFRTAEQTNWEGNPAAAFQVSHALD